MNPSTHPPHHGPSPIRSENPNLADKTILRFIHGLEGIHQASLWSTSWWPVVIQRWFTSWGWGSLGEAGPIRLGRTKTTCGNKIIKIYLRQLYIDWRFQGTCHMSKIVKKNQVQVQLWMITVCFYKCWDLVLTNLHQAELIGHFSSNEQWKKGPGCLGNIGYILPNYVGIIINHYKDPYETTSILESTRLFFVAHLFYLHCAHNHIFQYSKHNKFQNPQPKFFWHPSFLLYISPTVWKETFIPQQSLQTDNTIQLSEIHMQKKGFKLCIMIRTSLGS